MKDVEQADFLMRVWDAEKQISFGKNADMYRQLRIHGDRFSDRTWNFGVNYFFLGPTVFETIASTDILHDEHPERFFYKGKTFTDMDSVRAVEIAAGEFKLPQGWGDLFQMARQRRETAAESLKFNAHHLETVDPEELLKIQDAVDQGINLSTRPADIDHTSLAHALLVKMYTIHLQEIGVSIDIVRELDKERLLTLPEEDNETLLEFR